MTSFGSSTRLGFTSLSLATVMTFAIALAMLASCGAPGGDGGGGGGGGGADDITGGFCGDGSVGSGETCDDGNTAGGDGCSSNCVTEGGGGGGELQAFRVTELYLRDPHIWVNVLGCNDITDMPLAGTSVQGLIKDAIEKDSDANGKLDLGMVLAFRPVSTTTATELGLTLADCTAPAESTTCAKPAAGGVSIVTNATPQAQGSCLDVLADTAKPYDPAITTPSATCFASDSMQLDLSVGALSIPLQDARIAATYQGDPVTGLVNGLARGFMSEADAMAVVLQTPIGDMPLSSLIPGGANNCATYDDRDVGPDGSMGWYFYLNFAARPVTYSE